MAFPEEPDPSEIGKLAAIDEILQVMYWLQGEKLADDVTASDLSRWIGSAVPEIASLLERMHATGLIRTTRAAGSEGEPRYALTESGRQEGGRRFADEFAELTRQGHAECNDPNCDCHASGNPADCRHWNA